MIHLVLGHWPLVLTVVRGASTLKEEVDFLGDWERWLDRDTPFATLRFFADSAALERPEGAALVAKAWLQRNAERLRRLVLGMATIVPPAAFERMSRIDAEKLFGVPARTFSGIEPA